MEWLKSLGPSFLVLIGAIVTWLLKSKSEELQSIREKLREDQRLIYRKLLDPFIRLIAESKGEDSGIARQQLLSYDFRKTYVEFNLAGSDNVIRAYNKFMQHGYKFNKTKNGKEFMRLLGTLLLEIRKSLGNKKTDLNKYDMLEGIIIDIEDLKKNI